MVTQAHTTTTKVNAKVEQVRLNSPTRLIIYGGAGKASDNSAFMYASKNVAADYKNDLPIKSTFLKEGAGELISIIKGQAANTIQSLDLFCHGDPDGVYFIIGASFNKNIDMRGQALASNLYKSKFQAIWRGLNYATNKVKNQYAISELSLGSFTNESKIEIHGCNTGNGDDCFAAELSKALYDAGKKRSVVIGHQTYANPNIGGTTSVTKQDYRHGKRAIFHNGKIVKIVNSSGRISANIINSSLGG